MAGARQPISLLEAKNKKHLTKAEKDTRKKQEVSAPSDKVAPPSYLSLPEKAKFARIAKQLIDLKIMSNLDCDCLARHIQSETKYQTYDKLVNDYLEQVSDTQKETGQTELDISTLSGLENLRDKALKQCRASASDLGLSISSRCKLVVPKPVKEAEDPLMKILHGG